MKQSSIISIIFVLFIGFAIAQENSSDYSWLPNNYTAVSTVKDIELPKNFERVYDTENKFGEWLRSLPLRAKGEQVYLYNGKLKKNQDAHYRVIDIDVGTTDLQQCVDAVIRLKSEFLFASKKYDEIAYNFTSGDRAYYSKWIEGFRPDVKGSRVNWINKNKHDTTYRSFREYLDTIFMYAGSYSLSKELEKVENHDNIKIGDLFIQGGFPGHTIIVVDLCKNKKSGENAILLVQGFLPAQNFHVLKNHENKKISPWFIVGEGSKLFTPEWTFKWSDLKRFK